MPWSDPNQIPEPDHSVPVLDRRDLRDPTAVGIQLGLLLNHDVENFTCARYADDLPAFDIPDYSHEESTLVVTMREYQEKHVRLAAQGILASRRVCYERGWCKDETWYEEIAAAEQERPRCAYVSSLDAYGQCTLNAGHQGGHAPEPWVEI